MKTRRAPLGSVVLLAGCLLAPVFGQQPRVEVVQRGDRELRRTAYRLRMCPDDLRNARKVLEQAHKLAPSVASETWIGELGHLWIQLDPDRAAAELLSLLEELRELAGQAEDVNQYQQITSSAQTVMMPLREIDAKAFEALLAAWPEPEFMKALPEAQRPLTQIRREQLHYLAREDPDRVVERLADLEKQGPDFPMRSSAIGQLYHMGREEAATSLLDETLDKMPALANDRSSTWVFSQLVDQVTHYFPDRLPLLLQQLAGLPDELPGDQPIEIDHGGGVRLSLLPKENLIFGIARGLLNRPETFARVLDLSPSLRTKLEQAGGLDRVLSPPFPRPSQAAARNSMAQSAPEADDSSREVSAESITELVRLGQETCMRDPDGSAPIFERAARLTASQYPVNPVSTGLYSQVLNACLQCEGTVSRAVISQGELLIEKLREQAESSEMSTELRARGSRGSNDPIDQLEALLVAVTALEDFSKAMQMAEALPTEKVRFMAFLKIVNLVAHR